MFRPISWPSSGRCITKDIIKVYEPMTGYNVLNVNNVWFKIHIIMWGFEGLVD